MASESDRATPTGGIDDAVPLIKVHSKFTFHFRLIQQVSGSHQAELCSNTD